MCVLGWWTENASLQRITNFHFFLTELVFSFFRLAWSCAALQRCAHHRVREGRRVQNHHPPHQLTGGHRHRWWQLSWEEVLHCQRDRRGDNKTRIQRSSALWLLICRQFYTIIFSVTLINLSSSDWLPLISKIFQQIWLRSPLCDITEIQEEKNCVKRSV